jgi:hypothetical protein
MWTTRTFQVGNLNTSGKNLFYSKFSRECDGQMNNGRSSRRRDMDYGRFPPNYGRYSRYSLVTNIE